VSAAGSDLDLKRSRHRLNLLASSSISEALTLTNKSRVRARDILQVLELGLEIKVRDKGLLASSSISEALKLTNKSRVMARDILQVLGVIVKVTVRVQS
jgi:hypothetical protein